MPMARNAVSAMAVACTLAVSAWAGPAAAQTATDLDCSGCVESGDLANGSIGNRKLQDNSVGDRKIKDGAIGQNKIKDDAIVQGKFKDRAIGARKLKLGAVAAENIQNGAVSAAKLATDAVFGRILVVRNDPADPLGNCDELLAVLADITDNDAGNPYTVVLEPGTYDCGTTSVQMKPFVDLAGSGRGITTVKGQIDSNSLGVVTGANDSELRGMRVEHIGGPDNAVSAVSTGDTNVKITDLTAVAQNSAGGATGIRVGAGTPVLTNVLTSADNAGAPSAFSTNGVFVASGTPTLFNVHAIAGGGSDAWGLQQIGASVTTARQSRFLGGGTEAVRASGAVNLVLSQVDGAVSLLSGGVATCVNAYNRDFVLLDSNCSPIP